MSGREGTTLRDCDPRVKCVDGPQPMMQRDCQRGPPGKDDNYHSAFAILNFDYRCLHLWKFNALSVDQVEPVDRMKVRINGARSAYFRLRLHGISLNVQPPRRFLVLRLG
jgi:hypothetical protein